MSNRKRLRMFLLAAMIICQGFVPAHVLQGSSKIEGGKDSMPDRLVEAGMINTASALPDLIVKEISIVGTSKIKIVVQNIGDGASQRCTLNVKVFAGIMSKVLYSTRMAVPAILPHKTKSLFLNTKGRPVDGNSIKAIVDAANAVTESDEANNEENLITAP